MAMFRKTFFSNLILVGMLIIVSFSFVVAQTIPPYIYYQGKLVDQEKGTPIQGEKSITFSLYNSETAGTPIYYQNQSVNIKSGMFSVYIGKEKGFYNGNVIENGIPSEIFKEHSSLCIGIKIEGSQSVMFPRQLIASTAYAFKAEMVENANMAEVSKLSESSKGIVENVTLNPVEGDIYYNTTDKMCIHIRWQ